MSKTSFEKFEKLAKQGDIVPVFCELLADMETPLSVLRRFAADENVFLLESVEQGERFGRYSFLGVRPHGIFKVSKGRASYETDGEIKQLANSGNLLEELRPMVLGKTLVRDPELPPLPGGAVGFISYECAGLFEELPRAKKDSGVPEALFMLTDRIIAFDNVRHTVKIIVAVHIEKFVSLRAGYDYAISEIDSLGQIIDAPIPPGEPSKRISEIEFEPNMTKAEFIAMVKAARQYIHDGEAIQVVLSQKFSAPSNVDAFTVYRALRLINPSPYTFFLKLGARTLIGSSPETMVKLTSSRSCLRPIAGTRKRGTSEAEDRKFADELLKDEKERAEHLMLVDLGRNDIGRTAENGSVQVKSFMNVERYSHVMHLVSEVEALLKPNCDAFDLIKTSFPAGTLSGAPKIRAMEIINELEPESRGVYGGAVGYISYDGNMDMAITIRTLELYKGVLTVQAGAGIVYDSVPELEYEETLNKAGALFNALKIASDNLTI